jgi:hypothetical protein
MPLSKFRYYCKIALFRGVRGCSVFAVLQVLQKSLDVAFCCLYAVNINHFFAVLRYLLFLYSVSKNPMIKKSIDSRGIIKTSPKKRRHTLPQ